MKTLSIALFLLPVLGMCQEAQEILNTGTRPNGLSDYNAAIKTNQDINLEASELNARIERTLAKVNEHNAAKQKIHTGKDLPIRPEMISFNQSGSVDESTAQTKEEAEKQASEKRIQDAVDELRRSGTQARQSTQLDQSVELIPYSEIEKYKKSGVFEELGYQRGIDNDAIYNKRLKWYGGMDSGFIMNIVGSFMETVLSLPQLIMNLTNLLF